MERLVTICSPKDEYAREWCIVWVTFNHLAIFDRFVHLLIRNSAKLLLAHFATGMLRIEHAIFVETAPKDLRPIHDRYVLSTPGSPRRR